MVTLLSCSAWAKSSVFRKKNGLFLSQNVSILDFVSSDSKREGARLLTWNNTENCFMLHTNLSDNVIKIFIAFDSSPRVPSSHAW